MHETDAATITSRRPEYGSSRCPAMPAVTAKPTIIMTQTSVAADARRCGATRLASSTSRLVPQEATPSPSSTNDSTASAMPAPRAVAIQAVATEASAPPTASTPIPPSNTYSNQA